METNQCCCARTHVNIVLLCFTSLSVSVSVWFVKWGNSCWRAGPPLLLLKCHSGRFQLHFCWLNAKGHMLSVNSWMWDSPLALTRRHKQKPEQTGPVRQSSGAMCSCPRCLSHTRSVWTVLVFFFLRQTVPDWFPDCTSCDSFKLKVCVTRIFNENLPSWHFKGAGLIYSWKNICCLVSVWHWIMKGRLSSWTSCLTTMCVEFSVLKFKISTASVVPEALSRNQTVIFLKQ